MVNAKVNILDKDLILNMLDDIEWSYSNIKRFQTCKRCWYKHYILGEEGSGNFYSDFGTLAHKMLEDFANNKIQLFDMKEFVEYNWNEYIKSESPVIGGQELSETYYEQIMNFCEEFDGFDDKTVGTEIKISTNIPTKHGEKSFVGYIDRLSQDENGEYIINDYKSKTKLTRKELHEYSKQLYLYAKYVYETYGKHPKYLNFFLFRSNTEIKFVFNKDIYDLVIKEVGDIVDSIYDEVEFPCSYSFFYCRNLCEYRYDCTFD